MSLSLRGNAFLGCQISTVKTGTWRSSVPSSGRLNVQAIKELEGTVVSTKMQKTIVVSVTRKVKHSKYQKLISRSKKFYAHDEEEVCNEGDFVRIIPTRPLSKTKRYAIAEVIRAAK